MTTHNPTGRRIWRKWNPCWRELDDARRAELQLQFSRIAAWPPR
jgi:hypothetical protein